MKEPTCMEEEFGPLEHQEMVLASDHDRIVAELKAEVEMLNKELTSRTESLRQTRADWLEARKVIEKIKTIAEKMDCTCGSEGHSDTSYRDGGCFQREILESIERGEA